MSEASQPDFSLDPTQNKNIGQIAQALIISRLNRYPEEITRLLYNVETYTADGFQMPIPMIGKYGPGQISTEDSGSDDIPHITGSIEAIKDITLSDGTVTIASHAIPATLWERLIGSNIIDQPLSNLVDIRLPNLKGEEEPFSPLINGITHGNFLGGNHAVIRFDNQSMPWPEFKAKMQNHYRGKTNGQ